MVSINLTIITRFAKPPNYNHCQVSHVYTYNIQLGSTRQKLRSYIAETYMPKIKAILHSKVIVMLSNR